MSARLNSAVTGTSKLNWLFLILGTLFAVEILSRQKIIERITGIKVVVFKAANTIRSPGISDCWKEKALPRYSLKLLLNSIQLGVILCVSCSLFATFSVHAIIYDGQFIDLALSVRGVVLCTSTAFVYAVFISKRSTGNYGVGSRLLHRIVLSYPFVCETIFDIERLLHGSSTPDISTDRHVFVTGLARSGTTIFMRRLYESGHFHSLTYRDMPFILAPNSWRSCANLAKRKNKMQERVHGDGLQIDYDSPEALEEVFWRIFCGKEYIRKSNLQPMSADQKTLEKFRTFISLVVKNHSEKRYLSKNNNNVLRLESIGEAFPNGVIVVLFRNPLQQAYSLYKQHQRFVQKSAEDPFSQEYMTWLGHHEFGADHRPFVFDENIVGARPYRTRTFAKLFLKDKTDISKEISSQADNLTYWLRLWLNTYSYIKDNLPPQAILVSYESICDDTQHIWSKIAEKINLNSCCGGTVFTKSFHQVKDELSPSLLQETSDLYRELMSRSIGGKVHTEIGYTSQNL